jgi:hypothetical protein
MKSWSGPGRFRCFNPNSWGINSLGCGPGTKFMQVVFCLNSNLPVPAWFLLKDGAQKLV